MDTPANNSDAIAYRPALDALAEHVNGTAAVGTLQASDAEDCSTCDAYRAKAEHHHAQLPPGPAVHTAADLTARTWPTWNDAEQFEFGSPAWATAVSTSKAGGAVPALATYASSTGADTELLTAVADLIAGLLHLADALNGAEGVEETHDSEEVLRRARAYYDAEVRGDI
jgi:hypothetical protein